MTSRQRILTILKHKEPDRVPVDLGGMDSTGITAVVYNQLKNYFGLKRENCKVYDPLQQTVIVEDNVLKRVKADVVALLLKPRNWKDKILSDGSLAQFPEKIKMKRLPDGSEVIFDKKGKVFAKKPASGYYFDPVNPPLEKCSTIQEVKSKLKVLENYDLPFYWDQSFEELKKEAGELYENSEYAIFGNFGVHLLAAGQLLRGFTNFMMDLIINPKLSDFILGTLCDFYIERLKKYIKAVGSYIQIINVNDDLGTQNALQISPELYRKRIKPYHKRLFHFIKENSSAYLFLHSDGSIYQIIPDLIEIGVDILNPVQYTAKDMDTRKLKREFGEELVFWGGGCDTQKILPLAAPEKVREEVKRRIEDLAPEGGFVFCQVHNIQPDVPLENITAMYEAVEDYGKY